MNTQTDRPNDASACSAAKPAQVADTQAECTTCGAYGTIDERLGGYSFSNPAATCPDCDGEGYWTRTHADENAASAPTDRGIALAIDWARSNAGEHAAVIENALAAYDPERVGARTACRAAQRGGA